MADKEKNEGAVVTVHKQMSAKPQWTGVML